MPPLLQLSGPIKRFVPFIFAGVMGLLAVMMFDQYRQRLIRELAAERERLYADYQEPYEIAVAARDIEVGTSIDAEDLEAATIPGKFVAPYATSNTSDLIGLIASVPFAKGEQVLTNKLRKENELPMDATLSGLTPEGKRAVTIESNMITGVGGFVRPGDKVDMLWTPKLPAEQGGETVAMVLFQDVLVLAVGNQMIGRTTGEPEQNTAYTVTLALTPQETSYLLYAREQGTVQLTLRSRADASGVVPISPANSQTFMQALMGKDKSPASPQKAQRQVEVFKGLERSVVAVNE